MEYCLVENWTDECSLPENCKVVAISPHACYELEKAGIKYTLFNDFYDKNEFDKIDFNKYIEDQVLWFKDFDNFLKKIYIDVKNLDIRLASLFYYNIKFLIDHLISDTYTLNNFIRIAKPSKIYFIEDSINDKKFDRWHWFSFGRNSYFKIIQLICDQKKIDCIKLKIPKKFFKKPTIKKVNKDKLFYFKKENLIKFVKFYFPFLIQVVKNLKLRNNYFLNAKFFKEHFNNSNKRIFIIKIFDSSFKFISDLSKNGFTIKYLYNFKKSISPFSIFGKKIPFTLREEIINKNIKEIDNAYLRFLENGMLEFINKRCGVDVSKILFTRFDLLFNEVFPETIGLILGYIDFFNDNKINYVFTNSLATTHDFAACEAARHSKATQSIGFFHGIDAVGLKERYLMENTHFDLYLTSTVFESKYIEKLKKSFDSFHPHVGTFPYYKNYFINKLNKDKKNNKKILFLPIVRKKRNSACFTKIPFATMNSIEWHNILLEYFSSIDELEFIWKDNPYNENFDYSIQNKISDNKYSNIFYDNGKLTSILPFVDKVICDVPSTGFFEIAMSGYPVLTFKHKHANRNNLQKNANIFLGNSLIEVESIDEKLKAISDFLKGDPKKYVIDFNVDDFNLIEFLNKKIKL